MQGFATLRRRRLTLKIRISYIVIRIYKLPFCEFSEMPELKNKIHLGVVAWILLHAIFRSVQLIQS